MRNFSGNHFFIEMLIQDKWVPTILTDDGVLKYTDNPFRYSKFDSDTIAESYIHKHIREYHTPSIPSKQIKIIDSDDVIAKIVEENI